MQRTILVVDDSAVARAMIIRALQMVRGGTDHFLQADQGATALRVLERQRPDLLVTDLNMPVMDGMQLVREVRGRPDLADLPVVVVSTEGSRPRLRTLTDLGIDAFFRKPFRPEEIASTVKRLLGAPEEPILVRETEGEDDAGSDDPFAF